MTVMYLLYDVLRSLSTSTSSVYSKYEWHFIIVSNPDGYEYSWLSDRFWRKNRSPNVGAACALATDKFGTDLNRNFASKWGFSGSSTDPCNLIYQGRSAASELETLALQTHMSSISGRAICYLDVHW
jgi:murein tripeptide amidase MpaA